MDLQAPHKAIFWIAIVIAVFGFVSYFVNILEEIAFWSELLAFILLMVGSLFKSKS